MDSNNTGANRISVRVVEQKLQLSVMITHCMQQVQSSACMAIQAHGIDTDLKGSVTCHHANSVISTKTGGRRLP